MRTLFPAVLAATAMVAIPASITIAGHGSVNTTTMTAATKTAASSTSSASTHKYVGTSVDMRWGPVQVTIVVKGKTISDLSATAPNERARSAFINNQAIPMLRKEVLQAKTIAGVKNIYGISGATMTSEAFYQSLLSAISAAHLK